VTDARSHSVLSVFLFLTGNFSQSPDFGFCASQNMYYFGYKLHALCGLSGVIHSYDLSKASVADLHYMKDVKPTFIPFAKARKRIETIFSQLTDQFLVIRNYAKITNGLFARIKINIIKKVSCFFSLFFLFLFLIHK